MKILPPSLPGLPAFGAGRFFIDTGGAGDALSLGQIIKARVLRHSEGSRYAVDIDGKEKVVDSAVPLRAGELLHGKVVGLGDRAELVRIAGGPPDGAETPALSPRDDLAPRNDAAKLLDSILEQYRATLDEEEQRIAQAAMRTSGKPEVSALSAVLLSKVGLPVTPDLLRSTFAFLSKDARERLFGGAHALVAETGAKAGEGQSSRAVLQAEAAVLLLRGLIDSFPERALIAPRKEGDQSREGDTAGHGGADDEEGPIFDFSRIISNTQMGGSVAHRVNTLPLLVNGNLHEIDIALFDQERDGDGSPSLHHRRLVFCLDLDGLGTLQIEAGIAGDHVRLAIATSEVSYTERMALHASALRGALQANGWKVDELRYETRSAGNPNPAARSVLEHLISRDSLLRML